MRRFKDSMTLLVIIFSALFLINTGVMYLCFGVNAIKPVQREGVAAMKKPEGENIIHPAATTELTDETGIDSYSAVGAEENESTDSEIYMTAEEVQGLEQLDIGDKLAALAILSRIGSSRSERIYALAEDGLTDSEMQEIKVLLEEKLSEADMESLYAILDKCRELYAQKASNE